MPRRGLERLRYFVSFIEELERRHDLDKLGTSLHVSISEAGVETRLDRPDEHLLRSFLIDARRLFTQGEDTDLDVILPEAARRITDPTARVAIADPTEHYRRLHEHGDPQLVVDGEMIRPSEVANLLIQGTIFHGNAGKQLRLDQIVKGNPLTQPLLEEQALSFVYEVASIAIWVASVIRHEDEAGRLR